jgi:hypothetical protein
MRMGWTGPICRQPERLMKRTTKDQFILAGVFISLLAARSDIALTQPAEPPRPETAPKVSLDWLLDADSDMERFRRLQTYIRGYGQPMAEVGGRYLAVFQALEDRNYELASRDVSGNRVRRNAAGAEIQGPFASLGRLSAGATRLH